MMATLSGPKTKRNHDGGAPEGDVVFERIESAESKKDKGGPRKRKASNMYGPLTEQSDGACSKNRTSSFLVYVHLASDVLRVT